MTPDPLAPGEDHELPGPGIPDISDPVLLGLPFALLDRDVPLLLLPVGIATRYRLDTDPPALCIRIYPDPIHVDGDASPARAALLPRQWVALGYDADGGSMFTTGSKPVGGVEADLHVGLDAAAPTWTVEGAGLEVDDGLAWVLDYDRALEAGMAITVPLTGDAAPAADGVATLLVLGVNAALDPAAAQAELSRVLDVHRHADGLGFVAQGTPTNNTDSARSGWPPDETNETGGTSVAAGGGLDNAADFAQALGLGAPARWRTLPGGGDLGSQRSEAMRALLFEAVLGTMARELLNLGDTPGLRAAATNDLRDWFIDRVTGGAPVPCIRIGRQPYGIVPVQRATKAPDRTTVAGQVERIVALLIDEWRRSVELAPAMNPDDPDVSTDTAHESELAAVLAGQPHPARLLLRSIGDYETDAVEQFSARRGAYEATIRYLHPEWTGEPELQSPDREIAMLWDIVNAAASSAPSSIDEQIERWRDVRLGLPGFLSSFGQGALEGEALDYVDGILENLGGYERSQRPVRWLELDEYAGVLGEEDNTNLLAAWFTDKLDEWGDNGVVEAPDAPAGHRPADYLADLRTRFERRSPALGPSSLNDEFLARPPLFYQLLNMTLQLVPQTIAAESRVLRAFDQLADLDAESLEWLVRETLGLGVHRLDAWATSVASERLDELRSVRATGIQIGGFGWVTDLAPRQSRPPSQGFVLAPSLPHAATAAILRAGWQAHGGGDALSPAAIDLRSERVRAASWLLDGIRRAQPLGELLGQRFERWLHDAHADEQIRIVRQAVLDATDHAEMAPDQVVDGIELLDLYRTGALSTLDPVAVHAVKALETTFDAVNDVGTFEAVYQLAAANDPRAGAILDTLALGTASPPELRSVATPRSGRSVEHRVIGLWPPAPATPSRGWVAGDRDHIAPALEAWVASVLPRAADVGFAVRIIEPDGRTGPWKGVTLAELSASALDAVFLLSDDPTRAPNALITLASVASDVERAVEIDPQALGEAPVSLSEFSVAAIELRRVIGAARPATARDLRPAAFAGEADTDASAAVAAAEGLTLEFAQLGDRLDDAIQRRDPLALSTLVARLARLGLAVPGAPADAAAAGVLLEVVHRRIANMVAIKVDPEAPAVGIADRLAIVLGHRLPLLGSFLLAGSDGGEVIIPSVDLASESDVDDWLDAVAHVRSDVGRLAHAGLLATMLSSTGGLRLVAGQSPRSPCEQWAARHRPGAGSRVSAVFVVHPSDTPARGDSVCGLVFDQWSEVVPNPDEVAGLTFQYDAPSNRPPQAWLLAVAPRETPWSLTLVTETLLETLEWTKLRAVAPEDLLDYGRAIPTVFTPGTITRWVDDATEAAG